MAGVKQMGAKTAMTATEPILSEKSSSVVLCVFGSSSAILITFHEWDTAPIAPTTSSVLTCCICLLISVLFPVLMSRPWAILMTGSTSVSLQNVRRTQPKKRGG
ncbi:hypothetical protein QBC37DRAFT_486473 [Rhypophila decipiens]|uniref:Uncharacterized protein n=1 Tax=Rhypophila decipiens TaxID=261697 RepID=A0AAN7B3R8_9PEZI|nr:hypothetical protein QBC37DRAFT_486473 [Rhypophila decipiens]